jgi:hypothetical protein
MFVTLLLSLTPWRKNPKVHHRIQNSPPPAQPVSLRSILIPSSHLCLGLPSGLFPSGFPTKTFYTFLSSPMRATYPAHLFRFDMICLIIFGDEYKLRIFLLLSLLHSPVTPSVLGLNILLRTQFSNTHSLCLSLSVRDRRTTHFRLGVTAYSMYSQVSSISGGRFHYPQPEKAPSVVK